MKIDQKQNRKLFREIINGYSEIVDPVSKQNCFIKHFNELDLAEFENYREKYYQKAVDSKLPTEKEKEEYILSEKIWTKEMDAEISNKNFYLENLRKTKEKLLLISQIEQINNDIAKIQLDIFAKKKEKEELIGYTAEKYTENKMNTVYISNSYYKDKNLNEKFFSEDQINEFNDRDFYDYIIEYNKMMKRLSEDGVKQLALDNIVQVMIGLAGDNLYSFFGKPIVYLTSFQSLLLLYGRYFRGIISSEEYSKIPDEIKQDANKLGDWFMANKNIKNKSKKAKNGASFIMGASESDMQAITSEDTPTALNNMAKGKGGKLGVEDLAKFYKG